MAQEREKTRIVLASVLKPVDDTRMTGKLGATLAAAGYAVSIIGYGSAKPIHAIQESWSLGTFGRLSVRRYLARWKVLRRALSLRPDLFIFSTYELIFQAILLKVTLGTKIIYDVRENYYRNIRHSEGLPLALRWPLALIVRSIEKVTAPMIDHFFLAEGGYDKEFRFHRGSWTLIENKALVMAPGVHPQRKTWNLLFSGTLSVSTGVFRAMALAEKLHRRQPSIMLTVVGFAATKELRGRIRKEAEGKPYVRLIGIETLVPHQEIVSHILSSHAGIIAYPRMPHTINSTPTKLFEYLSARLPVICEPGWPWVTRFAKYHPFVPADFEQPDTDAILAALDDPGAFYPFETHEASWESEVPRLLDAVRNIV